MRGHTATAEADVVDRGQGMVGEERGNVDGGAGIAENAVAEVDDHLSLKIVGSKWLVAVRTKTAVIFFGVFCFCYGVLHNKYLAATGAMASLGQTLFRTGGRYAGVNDLNMAKCGNFALCDEHVMATRAMDSLGESGFATGGGDGGICNFVMLKQGKLLPFGETADGAQAEL